MFNRSVFIRLTRSKTSKNPTVQVVESHREGKKVRQKIIASLGVVRGPQDRERLISMGHALIAKLSNELNPQLPLEMTEELSVPEEAKINPKHLVHVRSQTCGFD